MAETLFDGVVRLTHTDAGDVPLAVLISKNFKEFGNTAGTVNSDPQKLPKVKKDFPRSIMMQDDKLKVEMKLDTTATEAASSNALARDFRIPVTVKNNRTNMVYEKTLASGDFTAKAVSAVSKVWATGTWYAVDELSIPAQQEYKLGHTVQDVRVDGALNLYFSYVA